MKIEINKKILKIKILEKINELKKENIIDIFCISIAFSRGYSATIFSAK
jgi:hypothetical protein